MEEKRKEDELIQDFMNEAIFSAWEKAREFADLISTGGPPVVTLKSKTRPYNLVLMTEEDWRDLVEKAGGSVTPICGDS